MRVFPLACRGLVITVVLVVIAASAVQADEPSVGKLQVRLVESRQHLNSRYAQSAAAAERLNGATYELEQAEATLKRNRAGLERARVRLTGQQNAVAAMTLQQLQSGSSMSTFVTMMDSDGTQQLLERASASSSTNEAMAARLETLSARQVVHDAAAGQAAAAAKGLSDAAASRKAAQGAIDSSIAAAETAVSSTAQERRSLLRQLADVQGTSVKNVARAQDAIDQRLDESGPDRAAAGPAPAASSPQPSTPQASTPEPSTPKPSTPKPSTTKPSTPRPKPATPKPADPPPASGSTVEKAISYARAQLGEPYKWGGAGPSRWDCSGLTMRAFQSAGVNLSHYAGSQYTATKKVSVGNIRRGDLLYWSNGGAGSIYHVALYLGGGQMIHAPRPGRSVEIVPLTYWIRPDLASRPG